MELGIVVMREWKIKDAQWKMGEWTISHCAVDFHALAMQVQLVTPVACNRVKVCKAGRTARNKVE